MTVVASIYLLNNELKQIFPSKVRIFSCTYSSDGQKSLLKNILSTYSFYQSAIRIERLGKANGQI